MESLKIKRRNERKRKFRRMVMALSGTMLLLAGGTFAYAENNSIKDYISLYAKKIAAPILIDVKTQMDSSGADHSNQVQKTVEQETQEMNQNISKFAASEVKRFNREVESYAKSKKQSIKKDFSQSEEETKQNIRESTNRKIEEAKQKIDEEYARQASKLPEEQAGKP